MMRGNLRIMIRFQPIKLTLFHRVIHRSIISIEKPQEAIFEEGVKNMNEFLEKIN